MPDTNAYEIVNVNICNKRLRKTFLPTFTIHRLGKLVQAQNNTIFFSAADALDFRIEHYA